MPHELKANFVNIVRITEVRDIDYIIQFFNTYSGESYVFKVYKELFDKAMEIRKIIDLEITVAKDEEEIGEKEIARIFT